MSGICLDGVKLKTLVAERYTGASGLLDTWTTTENKALSEPPDRATVYRWMKGQLPRSADNLLSLCSLLDCDPFSLLTVGGSTLSEAVNKLLGAVQLRQWKQPALSFLADLFGRQHAWPPPSLAENYFVRPWFTEEFEHDPIKRANYYAQITLTGEAGYKTPQIFHFAFQTPGVFGERWLQYGFVERYGNTVRLVHINGHAEEYKVGSADEPSNVETWFGPGPAVFRVASLHPFRLTISEPGSPDKVRFPA